jgi:hypothetical protein
MKTIQNLILLLICSICIGGCLSDSSSESSETINGSYSTMLVVGNKLYAVSTSMLYTFDVSNRKKPVEINSHDIGLDIESIFHHDGLLLIGSGPSMYIYKIDNQGIPKRESTETYRVNFPQNGVTWKDPIVARGNTAYVTLSTDLVSNWTRDFNELRIYNIENINAPQLLSNLALGSPKGLALGKQRLFICDQLRGLIVVNIDNNLAPIEEAVYPMEDAYDCIVKGNILAVVTKKTLKQFDISNENNLIYLGEIKF